MKILSKLQFYLTEKGRFDAFPVHVLGYPLLLVSFMMGFNFDLMGISESPGGTMHLIPLLGVIVSFVCLFMFKGSRPRPSVGIFSILLMYAVVIVFCSMPYMVHGFSVQASLFESVSGITTTGMSVMHLSELTDPLLMWRAVTGWIGGFMFITIFCLYLGNFSLPGRYIFSSGSASADSDLYTARVAKMITKYVIIYIVATLLMAALLAITGENILESFRLAMSTVSTTGFLDVHGGLDVYDLEARVIIGVFMLFAMFNYTTLFYMISSKRFKPMKDDNENLYIVTWILLVFLVMVVLLFQYDLLPGSVDEWVNVVLVLLSNASTTGFMVYDFSWPAALALTLSLAAIIGGSIDSTTGGIKAARAAIALKVMKKEITEVSFPNQVVTLRVRRVNVGRNLADGVLLMILMFFLSLVAGTILISFTEIDMESALYLAASAITTTGKGLYTIGTLTDINAFAQGVCAVLMIVGRLEAVIFLMLLSPDFWRDLLGRIDFRKLGSDRRPKL